METISGRTALVIGGSGGIGASICRELAKKNCSLIIHGGHDSDTFHNLVCELQKIVPVIQIIQEIKEGFTTNFFSTPLINAVKDADIICICFGPFLQRSIHEMDVESWRKMTELNLLLPGLLISASLPHLMQKKWGRLILFGGTRTDRVNAFKTNAAYAACKTGVSSLVRSTALEYASYGITCNAVFPGFTKTEYLSDDNCDTLLYKMPQKRLIDTAEIAEIIMDLLEKPMINGALVNIDGGWDPAF